MPKRIAVIGTVRSFKDILNVISPYFRSYHRIRAKPGFFIQIEDVRFESVIRLDDLQGLHWDHYYENYETSGPDEKMIEAVYFLKTHNVPLCTNEEIQGWLENLLL